MSKVLEIVEEIKQSKSQTAASLKDEVRVMRAMLNDNEFMVDEYNKSGVCGQIRPSQCARDLAQSIIVGTTKISNQEAEKLANEYEFKKCDAENIITINKEFINTYLDTGRKISLGGRADSNISFNAKDVKESVKSYPKKTVDENGNATYEKVNKLIPAHGGLKVYSSCPSWLKG